MSRRSKKGGGGPETLEETFAKYKVDPSLKSNHAFLYFPVGLVMTSIPIYLHHSIFGLELEGNYPLFAATAILSAMILVLAYHNVAFKLKTRLDNNREDIITLASIDHGKDKKRIQRDKKRAQKAITETESMRFSVLYNNALYLFVVVLLSFFVFKNFDAAYNYVLSVALSAGALSFFAAFALTSK
eukprot:CAMPEP_0174266926 /NCGR_PEP_ID=MMETSP0439-20130205/31908_1 /TAXON_ID=0 /ORGANISM="Stereomyxa ramosa, Strain Chinc5" /LENGTH=185 /DNA_ID=CAMNT_0015354175 /DNA_START=41 /DNA_END=598 /DNA_ORIENTATION=-